MTDNKTSVPGPKQPGGGGMNQCDKGGPKQKDQMTLDIEAQQEQAERDRELRKGEGGRKPSYVEVTKSKPGPRQPGGGGRNQSAKGGPSKPGWNR